MSQLIHVDGAEVEELTEQLGTSRSGFLKRAAIFGGGAAAVAAGAMPSVASAGGRPDAAILNFALALEYLESHFYAIAAAKAPLDADAKRLASTIAKHELQHVQAILATLPKLGAKPIKRPLFDFGDAFSSQSTFLATAMALEDTGVSAYNGAGPALTLGPVKMAAASIVAVEAMHAAWVRGMVGATPAPVAFDKALSKNEVLAIAKPFFHK